MEKEKLELKDGSPWLISNIKDVLQEIYDHYRVVVNRNDYLMAENARMKSDAYKDEELAKTNAKYEKMADDYYRGFPISEKEEEKINEWKKWIVAKYPSNLGAIGGRFVYHFLPTSIGYAGTIEDTFSKEKFTFREIS